MRKVRVAVALLVSISVAACQTFDGLRVNGQAVSSSRVEAAQGNFAFCEANPWVCVLLGTGILAGGAFLILGDKDDVVSPPSE